MSISPFGKGFHIPISELQDEFNRMIDRMWHTGISTKPLDGQKWAPAIDLVDEPTQFVLTAEVPGLSVADIDVSYEEGELIIKGQKLAAREETDDIEFLRRERRFGSFCRRVNLPERVRAEAITARCVNGLLEIVLPKKELPERKSVKIEVAE